MFAAVNGFRALTAHGMSHSLGCYLQQHIAMGTRKRTMQCQVLHFWHGLRLRSDMVEPLQMKVVQKAAFNHASFHAYFRRVIAKPGERQPAYEHGHRRILDVGRLRTA